MYPIYDGQLVFEVGISSTHLVENGAGSKGRHIGGSRFNDGSKDVEENGDEHQLDTAKDISNFGCGGLTSCGNDASKDIDGGEKTVLAEGRSCSRLKCISYIQLN